MATFTRQHRIIHFPFISVAAGYTTEFQDFWDRVVAAGSDISVAENRTAIDNFIRAEKNDGGWELKSEIYLLCGIDGYLSSWPKLKYVTNERITFINFVSGDYNRVTGLKGNGSSKYGNLNVTPAALGWNFSSTHLSVYGSGFENAAAQSAYYIIGFDDNTSAAALVSMSLLGRRFFQRAPTTAVAANDTTSLSTNGLILGSSTSFTDLRLYSSAGEEASAATTRSSQASTRSLYLFCHNYVTSPFNFSAARIQTSSSGLGLTGAQVATTNTNLQTLTGALT